MKIIYCKQCSPKVAVAANDASKVVDHNVYDAEGNMTATHTDFGTLEKEEPFTDDLNFLDNKYSAEYV